MKREALIVLLIWTSFGCGKGGGSEATDDAADADQTTPDAVKVCAPIGETASTTATTTTTEEGAAFKLAGVKFSVDVYPLFRDRCARCHNNDGNNNAPKAAGSWGYWLTNADEIIRRVTIGRAVKDYKDTNSSDDNTARDNTTDGQDQMPRDDPDDALSTAQIALWQECADDLAACGATDLSPEYYEGAVTDADQDYTSDEAENSSQKLGTLFATAACEDGLEVNSDENWEQIASLLAKPDGGASAFYDYNKKVFVEGATEAPYDCTFDAFIASLADAGIEGVETQLRAYESYGWRMTQCAVSEGKPLASMVTISATANTLGDKILGANFKTIALGEDEATPTASPVP